jgi:hypothetical protein
METEFEILRNQIESVHFSISRQIGKLKTEVRDLADKDAKLENRVLKIEGELIP